METLHFMKEGSLTRSANPALEVSEAPNAKSKYISYPNNYPDCLSWSKFQSPARYDRQLQRLLDVDGFFSVFV